VLSDDQRGRLVGAVKRLRDERDEHTGRFRRGSISRVSTALGISVPTLYRYVNEGVPASKTDPASTRWHWCEHAHAVLMLCGGDVTAARQYLLEDPDYAITLPSVRWMQFMVGENLAPDEVALIKLGAAAAKGLRIMLRLEVDERNLLWLSDHKQLDIIVCPTRGKPGKPWVTLIIDAYSRKVLGAALSMRPSQAHVLAALQMAIAAAGTPRLLIFDRGLEFTADAIAAAAAELDFAALPTRAYSPNHKGKVERVAHTLGRRCVRNLPHRTKQAKDLRGRPRITILDEDGQPTPAMDMDLLVPIFFAAMDNYNAARHSELQRSPNGAYREQSGAVPERRVDAEDLRRFLLKEAHRTIGEGGVKYKKHWYYSEELDGHRGERVEIRLRQDDLTHVEVYWSNGAWLCTADLIDRASQPTRERVLARRTERAAHQAKITRKARRMARRDHAALTSAHERLRDTTVITNSDAEHELRGHDAAMQRALKKLNLTTDLHDRTTTRQGP